MKKNKNWWGSKRNMRELDEITTAFCQSGEIVMTAARTCKELEQRIAQLEKEVLEYVQREKAFNRERKLREYSHIKRTISLMQINGELNRELRDRRRAYEQELDDVSHSLKERIKELNCLYDISSFRNGADSSLDDILQTIVDFIPSGCLHPESTAARIVFHGHEFATKNFQDTGWKLSREITVYDERIATLEVSRLQKKPELDAQPFLDEEKDLINAIAESVARIVEREWAEAEIRKHRARVEKLLETGNTITSTNNECPD
jgi:succinate dehydrogenase flavin-adding protein (antitoxin of CptAB toxin-antitoxin module)